MGATGSLAERGAADKARRLFLYLRELALLRSKTIRNVDEYEDVLWMADRPGPTHSWSAFDHPDDPDHETWLEVDRVVLPRPPVPGDGLSGWIRLSNLARFELPEPGLVEPEYPNEVPEEISELYRQFLNGEWLPWAQQVRELKPAYDFYTRLFQMSERRARLGEVYELVLGLGVLSWNRNGHQIKRHLITSPVELTVEEETGLVRVSPTDTEGRNRFELDMLDSADQGPPEHVQRTVDEIEAADPLELSWLAPSVLRRWVNTAHASGVFDPRDRPGSAGPDPLVTLAPALILRKRGQRTLVQLLGGIADEIESSGQLSSGVERLVELGAPSEEAGALTFEDPEVYFPLPANDEQRQIVERMSRRLGVLVQGPPGTGKSHTIANLVSHLLAQGKRVLVTSHTDRALRVLHDKLPDDIKPLCISVLGSDRDSIRALESAVEEISRRETSWSQETQQAQIGELRADLNRVRERKQQAANEMRTMRKAQTEAVSLGTYRGTRLEIAKTLAGERQSRGWLLDDVETENPPITNGEFEHLLRLHESLPPEAEDAARADLPDPSDLPTPADLAQLADEEVEVDRAYATARQRHGVWIDSIRPDTDVDLDNAIQSVSRYLETIRKLDSGWAIEARSDLVAERAMVWEALAARATELGERAQLHLAELGDVAVDVSDGLPDAELKAGIVELLEYARSKGDLRLGWSAPRIVRKHKMVLDHARVAGLSPTTLDSLEKLEAHVNLVGTLQALRAEWGSRLGLPESLSRSQQVAAFRENQALLAEALQLPELLHRATDATNRVAARLDSDWTDPESVAQVLMALRAVRAHGRVDQIRQKLLSVEETIGANTHPTQEALRRSIRDRDPDAYRAALEDLTVKRTWAEGVHRYNELVDALSQAAPLSAAAVAQLKLGSSALSEAWQWSYANTSLQRISDADRFRWLEHKLAVDSRRERELLGEIAAASAWQRTFEGMRPEHAQALRAWARAVKKIGKGTGRHAPRHRNTAREYMTQAREAIPAWIMPMYRVAESSEGRLGTYDVVIIDEASQSGVESLFLFHMAKQVVVVGDDQQIAPEGVGINQDDVVRLQKQFIGDVPFREQFEPSNSLFDQANIRFPGSIALREHFRCMPEIIEYSNRIAYSSRSLIPLRQFGSDRLDPIKTVYLPHGYRVGKRNAVNRPEANEIVERIAKLCVDPRYDGMSVGVVSLQGEAQAKLISNMLLERIGPQTVLDRSIVCGDAYAFQGDERNVMFLSMVAAPNERIAALANEAAKRRFNVAASRAQDQVWLVHSVQPEELAASDMRRDLLEYYLHPEVSHLEEMGERDWTVVQPEFDSRFEQDVYLALVRRGFRVAPQVPVAGYRIDLVVEGAHGRLAVECDGDAWHGPDRWDDDMARQRQLERCGWNFVRIRGSDFYRDAEEALEPLWRSLAIRGIEPGGYSSFDSRQITEEPLTGPSSEDAYSGFDRAPEQGASGVTIPQTEDAQPPVSTDGVSRDRPPPDAKPEGDDAEPELQVEVRNDAAPPPVAEAGRFPGLRVGAEVDHTRLGRGQIVSVMAADDEASDAPFVRIAFECGEVYGYSRSEFERAGFTVLGGSEDLVVGETVAPEQAEEPVTVRRQGVLLAPYPLWNEKGAPNPRECGVSELQDWLLRIVRVEGPVTADRAYSLLIRSAGFARVTETVRSPLNKALFRARGELDMVEFQNPETNWPQRVLTVKDGPPVVLRSRGPREFYEIPLNEIAAALEDLRRRRPRSSLESLLGDVLDVYEGSRLTRRARLYLEAAWSLTDQA